MSKSTDDRKRLKEKEVQGNALNQRKANNKQEEEHRSKLERELEFLNKHNIEEDLLTVDPLLEVKYQTYD